MPHVSRLSLVLVALVVAADPLSAETPSAKRVFHAGAAAVDITPTRFPVIVNGGFEEAQAERVFDALHARAIVLDDGTTRVAIVIVDNCMAPRELFDRAKDLTQKATGIPTDRMLMAATHTHSAPSLMDSLGTPADRAYADWLAPQLARAVSLANERLEPARAGWGAIEDRDHTHCRRWIRRPDRIGVDPFGGATMRANMHPGHLNPDVVGPSGAVDPDITLLAVQSLSGKPLAVLANYSMHYYGATAVSADYFGRFADELARLVGGDSRMVAIMSQGTSGDQQWMDYGRPGEKADIDAYAKAVAAKAHEAYQKITFQDAPALAMREMKLTLGRRVPDEARLNSAQPIAERSQGRAARGLEEVYAREQLRLAAQPKVELKLQAIRVGELAITAIPNEVFGVTGLKIKAQSPLAATMNIELANGSEGYIPPPEQHKLGGYTTWPALTAGLEVEAEPKIVAALLGLLEQVAEKPRRKLTPSLTPYAQAILRARPVGYWRLEELAGNRAIDFSGRGRHAVFEDLVARALPGPPSDALRGAARENRAAHFAGGRLVTDVGNLGASYSVEFWFWNGLPHDARLVTGYLFSRGQNEAADAPGDHLAIGGTFAATGRLVAFNGNRKNQTAEGKTALAVGAWNHVVWSRNNERIAVYLNGHSEPELQGALEPTFPADGGQLLFGGRNDNFANLAGKIDEVAVYDRVLGADEAAAHFRAAGFAVAAAPLPLDTPPPRSPAEGLKSIKLREGFVAEQIAAEPLVKDPVAIAWGPDGKLWVAEMSDYPLGLDGKMKACGRVRYLDDRDGDGRYETSTLYLDNVNFPNGIAPWRKGVLVTAAPDIFYAEDADGDGRAEIVRTLYRGFKPGNPQLRVNGLRWGLDGWLYCANGWSGGVVESVTTGTKVDITQRDLRIRPDEGLIEAISGMSEFGRERDDWGNWVGCDNSNPLFHYVLEDRYTRRNQHLAAPDAKRQLLAPSNPQVFAISKPQKRYHSFEQSGRFTSGCSTMIYRDDLLFGGQSESMHAFVCEPVHNLVHHAIVTPSDESFTAQRAEAESEFLASDDPWFRPVMVRAGPDGALWVVDMYRAMVEHPEYLPPNGQAEMAPLYRLGEDRGRIYRVFPQDRPPRPVVRLDRLSSEQLALRLTSASGYERDLAQQVLYWRGDKAAVPALAQLAAGSKNPRARLHALATLELLGALSDGQIAKGLADAHSGVRRLALRLAESRGNQNASLVEASVRLVDDPDAKVRLQLAWSLGASHNERAALALGKLAAGAKSDFLKAAVLSSISADNVDRVLQSVRRGGGDFSPGSKIDQLHVMAAVLGRDEALVESLAEICQPRKRPSSPAEWLPLAALLDAMGRGGKTLADVSAAGDGTPHAASVERIIGEAREIAADVGGDDRARSAAVRLLLREPARRAADYELLATLLEPRSPPAVQAAAVERLGRQDEPRVATMLLAAWPGYGSELRSRVLTVLFSRESWTTALVEALAARTVTPADFDASARQRLAEHKNETLRERAHELLQIGTSDEREKVLREWEPVLKLAADAERGKGVFAKRCAACHKQGDVGHEVGPNLAALTDRSPAALFAAILDPSRTVEGKYINYVAATSDGRTASGMLVESGGSVTLLGQEGKRETIPRAELAELRATGKSLMPDGMEKDLSRQELADLIAFLGR